MGWKLSVPHKRYLAGALRSCEAMSTPAKRRAVLDDLRETHQAEVDRIAEAPDTLIHTRNIVAEFARSGEWVALIECVRYYEGTSDASLALSRVRVELEQRLFSLDDLERLRGLLPGISADAEKQRRVTGAFHRWARNLNVPRLQGSEEPYVLLLILAGFPAQPMAPALQFVQELSRLMPPDTGDPLRQLITQVAARENVPVTEPAAAATEAILFFEMRPKAGGFVLSASLRGVDGRWSPLPTEDNPVPESVARDKFKELVALAEQQSTQLVIEMALPRELLCAPVDRWEIAVGEYGGPVGAQYPVVLRWLNRLRNPQLEPHWRLKWDSIERHSSEPLWLNRSDEFQLGQLLAMLRESAERGAFISLAFPPASVAGSAGDTLSVALSCGTPVAIWCRECSADPLEARRELQEFLRLVRVTDLPSRLKTIRNQAEREGDPRHPGHRIALLFDNPNHRPPQLSGTR